MTFRVARHTTDLEAIRAFYLGVLGLEELGTFQGHDGYDGLFIGRKGLDWHLEFTISDHVPKHQLDEDNLLVLYLNDAREYQDILSRASSSGVKIVEPRNPYWEKKGMTLADPDGFRVVIVNNVP